MSAFPHGREELAPAGTMTMDTARLRLRARTLCDLEAIVAMDADPVVRKFIGGPLDPRRSEAEHRAGTPRAACSWAIEWRNASGLLWLCGLGASDETGFTQIGWRLHRFAWGQGVATEAARAVLMRALGPIGLPVVVAMIHPDNRASLHVAEKIGMKQSGITQYRGFPQLIYRADSSRL